MIACQLSGDLKYSEILGNMVSVETFLKFSREIIQAD